MIARLFIKRITAVNWKLYRISKINVKAQYSQWEEIGGVGSSMEKTPDYSQWSTEKLIDRVTSLEQQLKEQTIRWAFLQ